ncbi:MAG: hypothetical protein ABI355_18420 [Solirubrobacteraceae bacterium]
MRYVSKFERPSPAMLVAVIALFAALTGGAYAATTLGVGSKQIKQGAVTHGKLGNNSVWHANLGRHAVGENNLNGQVLGELHRSGGATGPAGPKGDTGATGPQGPVGPAGRGGGGGGSNGSNGSNPAAPVINVPAIQAGDINNGNKDSGQSGDQGFFFSGTGPGGTAKLTNGELVLTGLGTDSNTYQGGIGIAKAYASVPLNTFDGLTYDWHVNTTFQTESPTVHITVTGLTADSHFSSGFSNLVYNPALNGVSPTTSTSYQSDGFASGAKWYSTTESTIGSPGGQNSPQPLSYFTGRNPNAVIGQISLDNGGSSGVTGNWEAGADNLLIGFSGSFTRYDFGG